MNIQNELSRAIISGNMEIVRSVYKYLFGTDAPAASQPNLNDVFYAIIEICNSCLIGDDIAEKGNPQRSDQTTSDESDESNDMEEPPRKAPKDKPKMQFISPETELDNDPKYKEFIAAQNAKPRPKGRAPYKAIMKSCDICGKEFNYSKTYPAGHFGDKIRCDGCQKR